MEYQALKKLIIAFFKNNFDLRKDQADELETIDSIKRGIEFKGANLWVLIFAIFIACLGLNVNSTAVIIGAMLISPLMGPIMGIGLGVGIYDYDLIRLAMKHYLFATAVGIIASTIYFTGTPLDIPQSELLARTSPTIYDVFIAFFGGMAGIVAGSRKEKGNVIPGVAIATALMPPLCTAGFGLATQNLHFFFGALYLYFINTVFISLATAMGARIMHFPKHIYLDKQSKKRVMQYIVTIVVVTVIPSIWMTLNILKDTFFEVNANNFINKEFVFDKTNIISRKVDVKKKRIEVYLVGDKLNEETTKLIRSRMNDYKLDSAELTIKQGTAGDIPDITRIKSMVLEDFYKENEQRHREQEAEIMRLNSQLERYTKFDNFSEKLATEVKVIFPEVERLALSTTVSTNVNTMESDTLVIALFKVKTPLSSERNAQLNAWLMARTQTNRIKLVFE